MEKLVQLWLLVDWRTGEVKARKTAPVKGKDLDPYIIPVEIKLRLLVPNRPTPKAEITVRLSDATVGEILVDELSK